MGAVKSKINNPSFSTSLSLDLYMYHMYFYTYISVSISSSIMTVCNLWVKKENNAKAV